MPTPPSISLKLESAMIGFKPDTADYQNGVAAKEMLQPYAADIDDYFEIYPDENIWIIGTTAAVQKGADGSVDLSLRRAEAVKETLIEFGVSKEKLITIGLGAKFPWSVDEFPEGHFDTKVAQANHAVWVLNTSDENEEFNMLKSAYENGALLPAAMDRISQFLR
jgi:Outer membrane protein and related peptidoglycan-associated (lipo)proteins